MDEDGAAEPCARAVSEAIFDAALKAAIGRIIDDVRANGDEAVCRALHDFDHVDVEPHQLRATDDELADCGRCRRRRRRGNRRRHRPPAGVQRAADAPRRRLELRERAGPARRREDHADLLGRAVRAERQGVAIPSVAYQLGVPAMVAGVPAARTRRAADARRRWADRPGRARRVPQARHRRRVPGERPGGRRRPRLRHARRSRRCARSSGRAAHPSPAPRSRCSATAWRR